VHHKASQNHWLKRLQPLISAEFMRRIITQLVSVVVTIRS